MSDSTTDRDVRTALSGVSVSLGAMSPPVDSSTRAGSQQEPQSSIPALMEQMSVSLGASLPDTPHQGPISPTSEQDGTAATASASDVWVDPTLIMLE